MGRTVSFEVRACRAADAPTLSLLGQATFLETFAGILDGADIQAHCMAQHGPDVYGQWLADSRYHLWLATIAPGESPIGYAVLAPATLPDGRDDDLEIKRIYLLHRFQGMGVGAHLMTAAIEEARQRGCGRLLLGVYAGNERAIAFYRRHGYRPVGERRFHVGHNEYEDVVLGLDLQVAA